MFLISTTTFLARYLAQEPVEVFEDTYGHLLSQGSHGVYARRLGWCSRRVIERRMREGKSVALTQKKKV